MLWKIVRAVATMSAEFHINAFESRAAMAQEKLGILHQYFIKIQQDIIVGEEAKLKAQNSKLVEKVAALKTQLNEIEQKNVEQQVVFMKEPDTNTASVVQQTKKPVGDAKTSESSAEPDQKRKGKPKEAKKPKQPKSDAASAPVDVSRLDFRVAQIVNVKRHPDADTLYVEDIDAGEDTLRTVVTGVVKFIPIEQMEKRMVILMCNLKPAKMRGILSQAMVMCANCPENVEIIDPPPGAVPGDRVVFEGFPRTPDIQLNPKKKVWEKVQPDLHTNDECVACYKGIPFRIEGKGVCKVQTLKNCGIK